MKLVTFNIQYGLGIDGKYDLSRIAPAVAGADVIALQEVDRYWQRTGMVDQPALIAQTLPGFYWIYGPNLDMDASYHDEGRLVNRRKQFGNMLLSKTPFLSSRNHLLPKHGTVAQHGIQQGILEGVINAPDGPIRLYSAHLSHLDSSIRCRQIETFLNILHNSPAQGGVWSGGHPNPDSGWIEEDEPPMPSRAVLMGDLNIQHTSQEYEMLVGPKSKDLGRINLRDGFADSWVLAGYEEAKGVTCPSGSGNKSAGKRIDYCLVTSEFSGRILNAYVDEDCRASDHLPYWVTIADP